MSHAMRIVIVSVATLAALCTSQSAAADEEKPAVAAAPIVPVVDASVTISAPSAIFGVKPVDLKVLARKRGAGADVLNDMKLNGVVSDNRAVNVTTGNNYLTDGAFANASGLPMVVQNTGNNVLIQNATIVNVQVK
jgi:hypothetical protein